MFFDLRKHIPQRQYKCLSSVAPFLVLFPVVEKYCATNRWQFTCQAIAQQLPEQEISK
jgi:hypothetical protein